MGVVKGRSVSPELLGDNFVELVVVFYLNPPNQNGTMVKDVLLLEKFISAECVRRIRQKCELCGLAACASSLGCNRTLIGQHDLAAANG